MPVMIDHNKTQHEIQREAQRQNARLMERIMQSVSATVQDNRLTSTAEGARPSVVHQSDPEEVVGKARKAFSSHFSSKLFSGKFGDDCQLHCEEFMDYCADRDIEESKFPDYIRHTVKGDARNFITGLRKAEPDIAWGRMQAHIADRYANVNRQKEVSDRLHSLRYADFETSGEDPATTLERIMAYIDNHRPIALPSDQTDAAKARFLSNATCGQTWALHAKGRISASATYERTAQALLTSITDMVEYEEGKILRRKNRRGPNHRDALYKTKGEKASATVTDDEGEPDKYFQETKESEKMLPALETFFGSSRFARDPRGLKKGGARSSSQQPRSSNNRGCYNCSRSDCSVAKCPRKKEAKRIAENLRDGVAYARWNTRQKSTCRW